jgi:hypothetical protein
VRKSGQRRVRVPVSISGIGIRDGGCAQFPDGMRAAISRAHQSRVRREGPLSEWVDRLGLRAPVARRSASEPPMGLTRATRQCYKRERALRSLARPVLSVPILR